MPVALKVLDDPSHGSCVRRVPLFAGLSPADQDAVAALARPLTLAAGALLPATADRQLVVVHRGRLRVSHVSASGRRRLLRVAGPGDVVGELAFLTGEDPDQEVEAAEPAQACVFRAAELGGLIARHPSLAAGLLRSLAQRLADAERRLALATVDVPARLASFLLDLPTTADAAVSLPWPKKDVASYLGTTPESLSRALDRLQRQGAIEVRGPLVRVADAAALESLAGPAD